jgi:nucleoside-diphosphate-sugar epimerase
MREGKHLGIYHIGTREEISIARVARLLGEDFGKSVRILAGREAAGGTSRRCPDIQKLVALGFKPKYPFREGLRLTVAWYVKNAGLAPK